TPNDDDSIAWQNVATITLEDGVVTSGVATLSDDLTELTYTIGSLNAGCNGYYKVVAFDSLDMALEEQEFAYASFGLVLDHDAYSLEGDALVASTTPETNASYQWSRSDDCGETWTALENANAPTWSIPSEEAADGRWLKLVATNDATGAQAVVYARPRTLEDAPLDMIVDVDTETEVLRITFNAVENATDYQFEYYLADADYPVWVNLPDVETSIDEGVVVATLDAGLDYANYKIRVRALDSLGLSPWNAYSPVAPDNLVVAGYDSETASVTLAWSPQEHADGFVVSGVVTDLEGVVAPLESAALDGDATGYTFVGVVDGYTYEFTVAAFTSVGAASSNASFVTATVFVDSETVRPDDVLTASLTSSSASATYQWRASCDGGETWFVLENETDPEITITDELAASYDRIKVVATGTGLSLGSESEAIATLIPYAGEAPGIIVTTADDVLDSTDNLISLREAALYREYLLERGKIQSSDAITFDPVVFNGDEVVAIALVPYEEEVYTYRNVYSDAQVGGSFVITTDLAIDAGDANVVIDGENLGDHVFCVYGANAALSLAGVTIRNANLASSDPVCGGAICANDAKSLTLSGCAFVGNNVESALLTKNAIASGGAISVQSSAPEFATSVLISNTSFDGNTASQTTVGGGAIYAGAYVNVAINDCVFTNNSAAYDGSDAIWLGGGAIYVTNADAVVISNSLFSGNSTSNRRTRNSVVTDRSAYAYGGAIYLYAEGTTFAPAITIDRSTFDGNRNSLALYCYGSTNSTTAAVNVTNSLFRNDGDAAINIPVSASPSVAIVATNSTFVDNAIAIKNGSRSGSVTVNNSIVWNNGVSFVRTYASSTSASVLAVVNTLASSNTAILSSQTNLWLASLEAQSPLDENAAINEETASVLLEDGSYLSVIDAGDASLILTDYDLAGAPRVDGDSVDLGAFEHTDDADALLDEAFADFFDEFPE
ncbi:MAG: hypothetical protein IJL92_11005, partial [Thermoguttaceae bacterium]|nr:hypothetical protein [Thermoguttaceae bacterium]